MNLIIGDNGAGKTFLLKALYSAVRTLEEYKRGNDQRSLETILADKLHWIFQANQISDLVTNGTTGPLECEISFDGNPLSYQLENSSTQLTVKNQADPRSSNSVFLPANEVLALHHIILKSRNQDRIFGFDDTYLDLARALQLAPAHKNLEFANSRKQLKNIIGGQVTYDTVTKTWQYQTNNRSYPIGITAEGIKKIAILDTLLSNKYLDSGSIIFIDEPEAALHPAAISKFLDVTAELAKSGMQFFFATHSYHVINKLFLLSQQNHLSIPVLSKETDQWRSANLRHGIPKNKITDESIRLYEEELELTS